MSVPGRLELPLKELEPYVGRLCVMLPVLGYPVGDGLYCTGGLTAGVAAPDLDTGGLTAGVTAPGLDTGGLTEGATVPGLDGLRISLLGKGDAGRLPACS